MYSAAPRKSSAGLRLKETPFDADGDRQTCRKGQDLKHDIGESYINFTTSHKFEEEKLPCEVIIK